jgi:hypothetical protein
MDEREATSLALTTTRRASGAATGERRRRSPRKRPGWRGAKPHQVWRRHTNARNVCSGERPRENRGARGRSPFFLPRRSHLHRHTPLATTHGHGAGSRFHQNGLTLGRAHGEAPLRGVQRAAERRRTAGRGSWPGSRPPDPTARLTGFTRPPGGRPIRSAPRSAPFGSCGTACGTDAFAGSSGTACNRTAPC